MRFSMRRTDVCPGEEIRILRKSAFWVGDVTEKRILHVAPHGKAHFGRVPRARLTKRRILYASSHAECVFP